MIDLHCHFLPGIDDGARDMEESVALIRLAAEQGIRRSVITPHIHPGTYDNKPADMLALFNDLALAVKQQDIGVELALAAEVRLSTEMLTDLPAGKIPFIGRYKGMDVLLLELPYSHIPPGIENLIKWLKAKKVRPLIAHPERNREVISDPHKALMLKQLGVMFQLTVGSFAGDFGEKVLDTAKWLVAHKCIHVVASDAHRIDKRPPKVKDGLMNLIELAGIERVRLWSQLLPAEISGYLFDHGPVYTRSQ